MLTDFPAFLDACENPVLTGTAMRLYAHLTTYQGIFDRPVPVKLWVIARRLGVKRQTAYTATRSLIDSGYITDCGRGRNQVRRVQVLRYRAPNRTTTLAA